MEEELIDFIKDELIDDELDVAISVDTSLFKDKLLDSMSLTQLTVFLEDTYKIKIGAMDIAFENLDTVANMAAFINRKQQGNDGKGA